MPIVAAIVAAIVMGEASSRRLICVTVRDRFLTLVRRHSRRAAAMRVRLRTSRVLCVGMFRPPSTAVVARWARRSPTHGSLVPWSTLRKVWMKPPGLTGALASSRKTSDSLLVVSVVRPLCVWVPW